MQKGESYEQRSVSKKTRILFPIIIIVVASAILPQATVLIGFLMFGNLIRECGMLVIFVVIGIIILATKLVNYLFSE